MGNLDLLSGRIVATSHPTQIHRFRIPKINYLTFCYHVVFKYLGYLGHQIMGS